MGVAGRRGEGDAVGDRDNRSSTVVPIGGCKVAVDGSAKGATTVESGGPGDPEGVQNDSNEMRSCCWVLITGSAGGGESEASRKVSDGKRDIPLDDREGEAGRSNIVLYLSPMSVLGISTSGDSELSMRGNEESFRWEEAKEGRCRARGGGEGLSWARMIRLASTDEGSMVECLV